MNDDLDETDYDRYCCLAGHQRLHGEWAEVGRGRHNRAREVGAHDRL